MAFWTFRHLSPSPFHVFYGWAFGGEYLDFWGLASTLSSISFNIGWQAQTDTRGADPTLLVPMPSWTRLTISSPPPLCLSEVEKNPKKRVEV